MHSSRSLSLARHSLLLAALLCILLARAAVPAGWMPMASAGGGVVLAPCSGMGAMALTPHAMPGMAHVAPEDAGKGERHPDPAGDHPCSGAGVSIALHSPPATLAAGPTMRTTAPLLSVLVARVGQGLAAPPPPQTGPPVLV